jgi:hypothetical protein
MSERRRAWEAFARERNVEMHFVNLLAKGLPSSGGTAAAGKDEAESLRAALQKAGGLKT